MLSLHYEEECRNGVLLFISLYQLTKQANEHKGNLTSGVEYDNKEMITLSYHPMFPSTDTVL